MHFYDIQNREKPFKKKVMETKLHSHTVRKLQNKSIFCSVICRKLSWKASSTLGSRSMDLLWHHLISRLSTVVGRVHGRMQLHQSRCFHCEASLKTQPCLSSGCVCHVREIQSDHKNGSEPPPDRQRRCHGVGRQAHLKQRHQGSMHQWQIILKQMKIVHLPCFLMMQQLMSH